MATGVPYTPTPFTTTIVGPESGTAIRPTTPYISVSEYRHAPTAVGTDRLTPAPASPNDSTDELASVILRASSWVDLIVFAGSEGSLASYPITESSWITPKPDGSILLLCNQRPVREVIGVSLGPVPSQLSPLNSGGDIYINGRVIGIPGSWMWNTTTQTPVFFGSAPVGPNGQVYAVWQYVGGYPLTSLTAAAVMGGMSITVAPMAGVYAGNQLVIHDVVGGTEIVTAAAAPSGATLTLTSGLQFTHTPPPSPDFIRVSALPRAVEQASLWLTSALLKTRGTRAMVMPGSPGAPPTRQALAQSGAVTDFERACEFLHPFRIAYLRP